MRCVSEDRRRSSEVRSTYCLLPIERHADKLEANLLVDTNHVFVRLAVPSTDSLRHLGVSRDELEIRKLDKDAETVAAMLSSDNCGELHAEILARPGQTDLCDGRQLPGGPA